MSDPRTKWRRKMNAEVAEAFRRSSYWLSPCQCSHHKSYKSGYLQALKDLGMFLDDTDI